MPPGATGLRPPHKRVATLKYCFDRVSSQAGLAVTTDRKRTSNLRSFESDRVNMTDFSWKPNYRLHRAYAEIILPAGRLRVEFWPLADAILSGRGGIPFKYRVRVRRDGCQYVTFSVSIDRRGRAFRRVHNPLLLRKEMQR